MKYQSHDGMHYLFSTNDAEKLKFDYFDRKYRPQNAPRRQSDPMVLYKHINTMLACFYIVQCIKNKSRRISTAFIYSQ